MDIVAYIIVIAIVVFLVAGLLFSMLCAMGGIYGLYREVKESIRGLFSTASKTP